MFDGDCGLCRASVSWLESKDSRSQLRCEPSSACAWSDAKVMPFADTVVVRDEAGVVYLRSSAVAKSLSVLPGVLGALGTWILFVNRWSALRALNDLVYRLVAKNRRRISNGLVRAGLLDSSCRVPSPRKS